MLARIYSALLFLTVAAAARPIVFRVSDPIHPGETALLFGDGIGSKVSAEGWRVAETGTQPAAQKLSVLQASEVRTEPWRWAGGERHTAFAGEVFCRGPRPRICYQT